MLKRSKKGFTLAELLIVVAIIAVLTAIAVPLFVGAINNAKDATKEANRRAVRGAAVVHILEATAGVDAPGQDETGTAGGGIWKATSDGKGEEEGGPTYTYTLEGPWYVVATLDKSGNIEKLLVNTDKDTIGYTADKYEESSGKITVALTVTELKPAASNTP